MASDKHEDIEMSTAPCCCYCVLLFFALLFPHLIAFVHGSPAVTDTTQDVAVNHPPFTPLPPTTTTTTRVPKCDRIFVSNADSPKNGTFGSPNLQIPTGHSRQCTYTFIAAEDERVQMTFRQFNLRGAVPECNREYIDLYTEIEEPGMELITTPFGGRYCGRNRPRNRISMYQSLVINFYTDYEDVTSDAFQGEYEFINATQYMVGTPSPNTVCSFTIYSDHKKDGEFRSPTYPGVYPKNLQCQYRFLGRKGQRVRLEFMDFDLVFGGAHCPFDFVKVYDGSTVDDPVIGTHCGQQRNLMIYSSAENLLLQFITLQRTTESENRGFTGFFEFSERYVNLEFIFKNDGEHIRGTECDQKILSTKESTGIVYSPNYPFPYLQNIVCKYYIYGMQDNQHLEKVRLVFEKLDIPNKDSECTDGGYLRIYLQGQEERQALDEFDHNLCGTNNLTTLSEGPRLAMVFSSGASQGHGFKAKYIFETDYKVPGTASPESGCHFTYMSSGSPTGEFNSPRYPANYPSNTTCEYVFIGKPGEQVKIVFNYFKTRTKPDTLASAGYNEVCFGDYLEVYEVYPQGRENKIGRYCSKTAPGPLISDMGVHSMKIILVTDGDGVASGFIATYTFFTVSKSPECGFNVSGESHGVITSPRYPDRYENRRQICHWYINVRPNYRILLFFDVFSLEGQPSERGCAGAVVRVWRDLSQPPVELCGPSLANGSTEVLTAGSLLKMTFATADKSIGAEGFQIIWTEVKEGIGEDCEELRCSESLYCVSNDVRCNEQRNCGSYDRSDEEGCAKIEEVDMYLILGLTSGIAFFIFLTVCLVCHRKRKRRRRLIPPPLHPYHHHHHHPPPPPPFEQRQKTSPIREISSMHFMSVDSV